MMEAEDGRVGFKVVCGKGCSARENKLRRADEAYDIAGLKAEVKTGCALRRGRAAWRRPSCTVAPNMALCIDGRMVPESCIGL